MVNCHYHHSTILIGFILCCVIFGGYQLGSGDRYLSNQRSGSPISFQTIIAIGKWNCGNTQSLCYLIWQRLLGTR